MSGDGVGLMIGLGAIAIYICFACLTFDFWREPGPDDPGGE
jgi:hypothetical protein